MRRDEGHARAGLIAVVFGLLLLSGCDSAAAPAASERGDPTPAPAPAETVPPAPAPAAATTVTLAFAGDVHFEGGLLDVAQDPESTLGPMSQALRRADVAMVNFESALTRRGDPAMKELETPSNRYWFRSPPASLDLLDRSGVDVVTVANNHGADYGLTGLRDTLRLAEQSPVAVVGVGRDAQQAFTPHRVSVRGTDVAVFAADASPRESNDATWAVAPGSGPGLAAARVPDAPQLLAAVRTSARTDDLVVVYLHWGDELESCPTDLQRGLARSLAQAGADVVVGSHAHLPLGSGMLGDTGTYVSYGLGNFFWYHGFQSETGVLQLSVRGDEVVRDSWRPAQIPPQGGDPQPLSGAARRDAVSDWRELRECTDLAPGPRAGQQDDPTGEATGDEAGTGAGAELPTFSSSVRRIGPALRARMRSSHDPATCPVPLADLRHLALSYVGFDGSAHRGSMVVNADVATDVVGVFDSLYQARFPIRRMRLVDAYGADDNRSMAANNTSAYNCRRVAGQTTWSEHAYGRAIDINPVQNPYVVGEDILPPAGRRFASVDRAAGAQDEPGVIRESDVVTRAFARLGWTWGGSWTDPDYQHFDAG